MASVLKRKITIYQKDEDKAAGRHVGECWTLLKVEYEVLRGADKRAICPICHTSLSHRMDCQHSTLHKGWKKWTFILGGSNTMILGIQKDLPEGLQTEVHITPAHYRSIMKLSPVPLTYEEALSLLLMDKGAVREFTFEHNGETRKGWIFVIHPRNEKQAEKIKEIFEPKKRKAVCKAA
jgi:hypothetical protein